MSHSKEFEELKPYLEQLKKHRYLSNIIYYDMATSCPEKSIEAESDLLNDEDEAVAKINSDPDYIEKLKALLSKKDASEEEKRLASSLSYDVKLLQKMPLEEYLDAKKAFYKSNEMWRKCKPTSDSDTYLPYWQKCIDYARKIDTLMMEGDMTCPYDAALDRYEPGERTEWLDKIFEPVKEAIKRILPSYLEKQKSFKIPAILQYDEDKQRHLAEAILNWERYDIKGGCLRESMHPFSSDIYIHDARITTKYVVEDWRSSLFSVIHEAGHALEFQNKPQKMYDDYLEGVATAAICETHSRYYENLIGRSKEFMPILKGMCASTLGSEFNEIDDDSFYHMVNWVEPSLIRTEADELTYSLHIIIRYEIERDLINGKIDCKDVSKIWKEKYKEYLGVEPSNDAEGFMQDIHWTDNEIGYFPSYLLGNLYGAMIFKKMDEEIGAKKLISENKMDDILSWLRDNDYLHDWMEPKDWIKAVTGLELDPSAFIEYLEEKYK